MNDEIVHTIKNLVLTFIAIVTYSESTDFENAIDFADKITEFLLHIFSGISVTMLIVINWSEFLKKIKSFSKKDKKVE